jgi:hypothetical protein
LEPRVPHCKRAEVIGTWSIKSARNAQVQSATKTGETTWASMMTDVCSTPSQHTCTFM